MNISLAEGQNSREAINRRAEHSSEWVRHECGVSRLIHEHTTVARRTSGESQLTTRLCREMRAYMSMTEEQKSSRGFVDNQESDRSRSALGPLCLGCDPFIFCS